MEKSAWFRRRFLRKRAGQSTRQEALLDLGILEARSLPGSCLWRAPHYPDFQGWFGQLPGFALAVADDSTAEQRLVAPVTDGTASPPADLATAVGGDDDLTRASRAHAAADRTDLPDEGTLSENSGATRGSVADVLAFAGLGVSLDGAAGGGHGGAHAAEPLGSNPAVAAGADGLLSGLPATPAAATPSAAASGATAPARSVGPSAASTPPVPLSVPTAGGSIFQPPGFDHLDQTLEHALGWSAVAGRRGPAGHNPGGPLGQVPALSGQLGLHPAARSHSASQLTNHANTLAERHALTEQRRATSQTHLLVGSGLPGSITPATLVQAGVAQTFAVTAGQVAGHAFQPTPQTLNATQPSTLLARANQAPTAALQNTPTLPQTFPSITGVPDATLINQATAVGAGSAGAIAGFASVPSLRATGGTAHLASPPTTTAASSRALVVPGSTLSSPATQTPSGVPASNPLPTASPLSILPLLPPPPPDPPPPDPPPSTYAFTETDGGQFTFTLHAVGQDGTGNYTLDEAGTTSLSWQENGGPGSDNWTFDEVGTFTYLFQHTGQANQSGTQTFSTHEVSGGGPLSPFNLDQFNQTHFYGFNASQAAITADASGTETNSFHETGTTGSGPSSVTFTVDHTANDSYSADNQGTDTLTSTGSSSSDKFSDGGQGAETFSLHEVGTVTTATGNASLTLDDSYTDGFSGTDSGTDTNVNGSDTESDGGSDTDNGSETFSIHEQGTNSNAGTTVTFTLDDSSTDGFNGGDTGSDSHSGPVSSMDTFTDSDSGKETYQLHETGLLTTATGSATFTYDENANETLSDSDNGMDANSGGADTMSDTFTGGDGGAETYALNLTGSDTSNGITLNLSVNDGSTDTFGDQDNGTDASSPGSSSSTDSLSDGDGGAETFGLNENGSITTATSSATFTLTDGSTDTFGDHGTSLDSISNGAESSSDTYTGGDGGAETVSMHEGGSISNSGSGTATFTFDDHSATSFSDHDNDTESYPSNGAASSSDTFTGSDGGAESDSLHETGTLTRSTGSASFTYDDQSSDTITEADTGTDATSPGMQSSIDSFTGGDKGSQTVSLHESGGISITAGHVSFTLDDSPGDTFSVTSNGQDTLVNNVDANSDGFTEDGGGGETVSLHETGSAGGGGGNVTFAVDDNSLGTFSDHDAGSDVNTTTAAIRNDAPTESDKGSETYSVHEGGSASDGSGTSGMFTLDDQSADSYSDVDSSVDSTTNGSTASTDSWSPNDSGGETISVHEGGNVNQNGVNAGFTLDDSSTATYSDTEAGSDSSNPTAFSSNDTFGGSQGGADTYSFHEAGTDIQPNINGLSLNATFTVDDRSTSSIGGKGGGMDTVSNSNSTSMDTFSGAAMGTESHRVSLAGTVTNAGGSVSFSYSDGTGGTYSNHGTGADQSGVPGVSSMESITDDDSGADTFAVSEGGTVSTGPGETVTYTISDGGTDGYSENNTDADVQIGATSDVNTDTFTDTDTGGQSHSLHETGSDGGTTPDTFTNDSSASGTFSYHDGGTDAFNNNAETLSQTFTFDDGGAATASAHETGTENVLGHGLASFTTDDSSIESYSDHITGPDTFSNGSDAYTDSYTSDEGGAQTASLHVSGSDASANGSDSYTSDDNSTASFSVHDTGTNDSTGHNDHLTTIQGAADTYSFHETGVSTNAQGTVTFTLDNGSTDSASTTDVVNTGTTNSRALTFAEDHGTTQGSTSHETGGDGSTYTFTLDQSAFDSTTSHDAGSENFSNGHPVSGSHTFTADESGQASYTFDSHQMYGGGSSSEHDTSADSHSAHETGSDVLAGGNLTSTVSFTFDDHGSDNTQYDATANASGSGWTSHADSHRDGADSYSWHETLNQTRVNGTLSGGGSHSFTWNEGGSDHSNMHHRYDDNTNNIHSADTYSASDGYSYHDQGNDAGHSYTHDQHEQDTGSSMSSSPSLSGSGSSAHSYSIHEEDSTTGVSTSVVSYVYDDYSSSMSSSSDGTSSSSLTTDHATGSGTSFMNTMTYMNCSNGHCDSGSNTTNSSVPPFEPLALHAVMRLRDTTLGVTFFSSSYWVAPGTDLGEPDTGGRSRCSGFWCNVPGIGYLVEIDQESKRLDAELNKIRARQGLAPLPPSPSIWKVTAQAAAEGLRDGAAITANTFTFGQISSLNNYVDQVVAENGGLYQAAQIASVVGREALITAGTLGVGQVLRAGVCAGYSVRAVQAARAAQTVITARDLYQTGQSAIATYQAIKAGDGWGAALNGGLTLLGAAGSFGGAKSIFTRACFAAGTPLLTPDGDKPVEQFQPGDWILTAPEDDPNGPLEAKQVEEVFDSHSRLLHVQVNGQVIRTTAEHPFWVRGRGWTDAKDLMAGDWLRSHDERWVRVTGVVDSGEMAPVYNLRVADYHTYFVGRRDWGFSVWAHNKCTQTWNTSKNARILAKKLGAAPTNITSPEAHHIVTSTLKKWPAAQKARAILNKVGIDINAKANGVWLPHNLHHGHGLHSKAGVQKVYDILLKAYNKGAGQSRTDQRALVTAALEDIRKQILAGKFVPGFPK
jgi:hypothetical protein